MELTFLQLFDDNGAGKLNVFAVIECEPRIANWIWKFEAEYTKL